MSLVLNGADTTSSTWQKLRRHLTDRLNNLREENDSLKLTEVETAAKRGRIAQIVEILDLEDMSAAKAGLVPFKQIDGR
jgi:hypothetical protein